MYGSEEKALLTRHMLTAPKGAKTRKGIPRLANM